MAIEGKTISVRTQQNWTAHLFCHLKVTLHFHAPTEPDASHLGKHASQELPAIGHGPAPVDAHISRRCLTSLAMASARTVATCRLQMNSGIRQYTSRLLTDESDGNSSCFDPEQKCNSVAYCIPSRWTCIQSGILFVVDNGLTFRS